MEEERRGEIRESTEEETAEMRVETRGVERKE